MREILFKAKTIDGNRWIYGALLWDEYKSKKRFYILEDNASEFDLFEEVHPETVCQFTGLLDKKGNKIFDEDKVESKKPFYSTNEAVVKWMDGRCGFYFIADTVGSDIINSNPFQSAYKLNSFTVEIIGNIHD